MGDFKKTFKTRYGVSIDSIIEWQANVNKGKKEQGAKVRDLKDEMERYKRERDALKKQLEKENYLGTLDVLKEEREAIQRERESFTRDLDSIKRERDDLERSLATLRKKILGLAKDIKQE